VSPQCCCACLVSASICSSWLCIPLATSMGLGGCHWILSVDGFTTRGEDLLVSNRFSPWSSSDGVALCSSNAWMLLRGWMWQSEASAVSKTQQLCPVHHGIPLRSKRTIHRTVFCCGQPRLGLRLFELPPSLVTQPQRYTRHLTAGRTVLHSFSFLQTAPPPLLSLPGGRAWLYAGGR
jgi:hypothetical protein